MYDISISGVAIWFANLFGQKAPVVGENGGDYIGSMISWALTCVSFKSKVANVVSSLLPVVIKQVSRWFNGSFDCVDFLIDIAVTILSFIINKCIDRTAKNKLEKIIKKAGKGNGSHRIIKVKQKRLDLKIKVLGMKFNLGINISSFFVSSVYSLLSNLL